MRNSFIGVIFLLMSVLAVFQACQSEQELTYIRYYMNGKSLYETHCQNCHNADGRGLGSLIPPLTDSVFLKVNKEKLACMIKYGLKSRIKVGGKEFEESMPGNTAIAEIEVAEIITYITNSFGNKQGLYETNKVGQDLKACSHENTNR